MAKYKGQDVTPMGRRLRIDITSNDIRKGKPLDPEHCAAAQCILRSTNANEVAVHRGVVYIQPKEGAKFQKFRTSSALRMETIIFDRGGAFMPGEYDLEPVPLKEVVRNKRKSPSQPRTSGEMRLTVRRRVIPGVRRTARSTTE